MNILITGGPVHAYLDAVKIITNKFKGGLMCELAELLLYEDVTITYLTAKGSKIPDAMEIDDGSKIRKVSATVIYHDGFEDYQKKVLDLAPKFDAVILGAAVANLIPLHPLKGKFPSHNYKPGDVIPIEFTIAPRIIDEVKKVAPKAHLFGFKLLSGVPHEELITAAYGVLLESHATAVFANDATDLLTKYTVTKERGVHKMNISDMVKFVKQCVQDTYYHTETVCHAQTLYPQSKVIFDKLATCYASDFPTTPEGYVFGSIAIRNPDGSFLTTGRGKNELDDTVTVIDVNQMAHLVMVAGNKKASLNAPLMDWIFKTNPKVHAIVHTHTINSSFPTKEYAIPGTVRDSKRTIASNYSFNIANHGCFILLDNTLHAIL